MAKGQKTGGRKKGVPNKTNAAREAAIAASGMTPLEYMLHVMRRPIPEDAEPLVKVAMIGQRFEAAKAAAPYVHPKLHTIQGDPEKPIEHVHRLEPKEYARRIAYTLATADAEILEETKRLPA